MFHSAETHKLQFQRPRPSHQGSGLGFWDARVKPLWNRHRRRPRRVGTPACSWNERVRRPVSRVLSTPRKAMDGHSSGTPVTGRLARPTRAATRKHRCRLPGVPPLFGLAPGGVCRAASVAGRAVGSYPTVSPLPARSFAFAQDRPAVCSLWHCPSIELLRSPRRYLAARPMEPGLSSNGIQRILLATTRLATL